MATSNWSENRKQVWAWVIIVILLLIALYAVNGWVSRKSAQKQAPAAQGNKMDYVKAADLPKFMPADIPLETGAAVASNYNATAPNGQVQATRVFISSKTLQQNFDIYNGWLKQGSWKILSTINSNDKPNQKLILAQNAAGFLTVNITAIPNSKNTQVDLTYLKTK